MKISKKVGRSTMARELVLNLNKKKSHFQISKIDRKKLYGFKKRLYLDEKGKECSRANLEEETGIVFVSSDISSCYINYNFCSCNYHIYFFCDHECIGVLEDKQKQYHYC